MNFLITVLLFVVGGFAGQGQHVATIPTESGGHAAVVSLDNDCLTVDYVLPGRAVTRTEQVCGLQSGIERVEVVGSDAYLYLTVVYATEFEGYVLRSPSDFGTFDYDQGIVMYIPFVGR